LGLVKRKSSEKNPETPQQDFVVDKKKKIRHPCGGSVIIPLNLIKISLEFSQRNIVSELIWSHNCHGIDSKLNVDDEINYWRGTDQVQDSSQRNLLFSILCRLGEMPRFGWNQSVDRPRRAVCRLFVSHQVFFSLVPNDGLIFVDWMGTFRNQNRKCLMSLLRFDNIPKRIETPTQPQMHIKSITTNHQ